MADEDYSYFRSSAQLRAGVMLWHIWSPILIVFGTIGNSLSIAVLSRPKFNKVASSVYLIGLAAADMSYLYVGLLRNWMVYLLNFDIRYTSSVMCKLTWWMMYANGDVCVWILTAITAERLIAILCPTKSKVICTTQRAKIVISSIVLAALVINSHTLYGFGPVEIEKDNTTIRLPCIPNSDSYEKFFDTIWTWMDLCKYSLVPFVFLSCGNICIVWRVIQSSRKARLQVRPAASGQNAEELKRGRRTSAMSKLLVCMNLMFIVCTSPICIYFISEPYWVPKTVPRKIQFQDPVWAVSVLMNHTNNACNFILYCFGGSMFRNELKQLFKRKQTTITNGVPTGVSTVQSQR